MFVAKKHTSGASDITPQKVMHKRLGGYEE